MKTSISENETRTLTKVIFSWSFLWFAVYLVCVLVGIGVVSFAVAYFTDYFFSTDIISSLGRYCVPGAGAGIIVCLPEKIVVQIMTSPLWPIIFVPIAVAIIGSLKYDRIRRKTIVVR